jgi:hypothetical protein
MQKWGGGPGAEGKATASGGTKNVVVIDKLNSFKQDSGGGKKTRK